METGLFCNNASITPSAGSGQVKILGDPTEAALLVSAAKSNLAAAKAERVMEIPFSSERKVMTVVIKDKDSYEVEDMLMENDSFILREHPKLMVAAVPHRA